MGQVPSIASTVIVDSGATRHDGSDTGVSRNIRVADKHLPILHDTNGPSEIELLANVERPGK